MRIEINNYTKELKGRKVLNNITYVFEEGKIYGLYGRNGSGKTMLLRALCGLIYPSEGNVIIDGMEMNKDIEFPNDVGVIIENMNMLLDHTAFENLKILAKINRKIDDDRIREALEMVGLDSYDKRKVRQFSLGMRQKLNIAQAIMEYPRLLLLDEPTNALDAESVQKVREILLKLKKEGTIIIIASHNNEDLNVLSDQVIQIIDGQIA